MADSNVCAAVDSSSFLLCSPEAPPNSDIDLSLREFVNYCEDLIHDPNGSTVITMQLL